METEETQKSINYIALFLNNKQLKINQNFKIVTEDKYLKDKKFFFSNDCTLQCTTPKYFDNYMGILIDILTGLVEIEIIKRGRRKK